MSKEKKMDPHPQMAAAAGGPLPAAGGPAQSTPALDLGPSGRRRRAPLSSNRQAAATRDGGAPAAAAPGATEQPSYAAVVKTVAADPIDRAVFGVTAVAVGLLYSLLLPFAFTQRLSFANWHYIDGRYIAFSLAFGLGFGWLVTLQVHAVRVAAHTARQRSGGAGGTSATVAALLSVLPSLLCCSPIVPTVIGLLGLSAGARVATSARLQHFFATNENALLAGGLLLLVATGGWALRKLTRASCLAGDCCLPAAAAPKAPAGPTGEAS